VSGPGDRAESLSRLEHRLDHRFEDRSLLETALRHASYSNEVARAGSQSDSATDESGHESDHETTGHNERLEFLGDAVLGLTVAHALYLAQPDWREGDLSRTLHALVEGRSLAKLARSFDLGSMLQLGQTEQQSGGHDKASILENAMEAVIGAIYLDGGLPAASAFVERAFGDALSADAPPVRRDPKTELQERVMAIEGSFPAYRVVVDSEVDGDEERFSVEVFLGDRTLASGVGRTKRAAERRAARQALARWCDEHPDEG